MKKSLLVTLITAAVGYAGQPLTLTLDQAIETALQNNTRLKISRIGLQIADAQYQQALSARYPTLDLTAGMQRRDEALNSLNKGTIQLDKQTSRLFLLTGAHNQDLAGQKLGQIPPNQSPNFDHALQQIMSGQTPSFSFPYSADVLVTGRDTYRADLDLSYPLFTGGKVGALIRRASLNKTIRHEGIRRTRAQVIYDTRRYYYAVRLAEIMRDEIHITLERLKLIRDLTEAFYKGRSLKVKKTDYLRTLVAVDLAQSAYEEAVSRVRSAKAALINTMGLPWNSRIEIAQKRFDTPEASPALEKLIDQAYRYNPDYAKLRLAIRVSGEKIKERKSAYLPKIGLQAGLHRFDSDQEGGLNTPQNRNAWTIGVGLSWNLFSGFRDKHRIEEARLNKHAYEEKEVYLKEGLALQVKAAFIDLDKGIRQYKALHNAVNHAKENAELNIRAYRAEMVETKDVIEAQIMETFVKTAYYRALHDYADTRALIDFIIARSVGRD